MFDINHILIHGLQIFSPIVCLFILFIVLFFCGRFFCLKYSHLFDFTFVVGTFVVSPKNSLPRLMSLLLSLGL